MPVNKAHCVLSSSRIACSAWHGKRAPHGSSATPFRAAACACPRQSTEQREPLSSSAIDIRTRALKERIYATFTGLAILGAISTVGHSTGWDAFVSIAVGVLGISAAGFLAEVLSHQVNHQTLPDRSELGVMGRIALSALGSASAPLVLLAVAGLGILDIELALQIGMAVYALTLVVIFLIASHRSGLRPMQRMLSSRLFVALALVVVAVLLIAHLH